MKSGLEGVIAAETVLSHSDGERGILWVRGHALPELAGTPVRLSLALVGWVSVAAVLMECTVSIHA